MTGSTSLADYVSQQYMPWIKENKAPSTVRGSIQIWAAYIEPRFGKISLVDLRTEKITELLDSMAKQGFGTRTLSHTKWLLSGVYEYAINRGVVHNNPVTKAKWLVKAKRPKAKIEYSLTQVLDMLRVLEPVDLRATVAVALCYFTSCRPSEARGLRWEDWRGEQLDIKRAVWRTHVGDTKTEGSAATVPVIEPLKSLLARLRAQQLNPNSGYMLRNYAGKSLNLDSLNVRIIAPTLKKAGTIHADAGSAAL